MKIAIIDYGAGNIQSVKFALQRLGYQASLTADPEEISAADKVIFPGVGAAGSAMEKLRVSGLDALIPTLKQPVLGICVGMQLMCRYCEEGDTRGLGIFEADVRRFDDRLKVPQIGWNQITQLSSSLFHGIAEEAYMYLVHSYYAPVNAQAIASATYGVTYAAALQEKNFYGVQFHPEKSSREGARILKNFLTIDV
ncbi:MAG: imidazole glycerol phosphate synthase subunit HisH [Lutibacter sp.]|jgi:glutamine amidotransferase|nr:imidazole glycerol phosphate synthase subunit HisH [Lutibacter sp.]